MLRKASSAVLSAVSICGTLAAFSGDKAVSIGAQGLRVACIPILLLALALGHNAYCRQAQAVSVVQTTADQKQLLQSQPAIAFNGAKGGAFTITVTDVARQPFDGVGAALTDSGAWLIANKLSSDQRSNLLHSLFSPEGAGLDVLTTGMSGSGYDVNGPASFTYDDIPSGTDFPQRHFSVKHDDAYIVPVLHQILRLNPKLKLFAVPYSAPAWMKNSDKLDTGSLIAKPAYERSFATYFVKYVQAYRKRNISIYALLIQNEPDYVSGTYPSMLLPAAVEGRIIAYLGPALKKAGFGSVKILGWDHNWSVPDGSEEHGDRRVLNVSGGDDGIMYPEALFARRRVKSYLAGTAYHCYGGAPATQLVLKHKFPKKGIWNTECAGGSLKQAWVKAFDRNMAHKILPEIQDWSRSHVWWTLVQDQNFGPESGNCTSAACSPLVLIDTRASRAKIVYLPGYYMLAQIGRFVRPGAYCVESHDNGIPEAAFRNPDGSLILVA
jgi:glucosylceramidase